MRARAVFVGVSVALVMAVAVVAGGGVDAVSRPLFKLVGVFGQVVALVRSSWVEEVDVARLEMGAVTGLIETADPGGAWVPEADAQVYAAAAGRQIPAFGLVLGKRTSYPVALQVLAGSPAAKAGLVPGELLERVGDTPVRARPLWLAMVMLERAERAGASLELEVIDRYLEGKRQVTLEPGGRLSLVPEVSDSDGVPVIRIPSADGTVAAQLEGLLLPLARAEAVVVDARGLALGSVEGAVKLAAAVAGGEARVRLTDREGEESLVEAKGLRRSWRVVVCTDGTTAGAGESLVAALKELGATVVGSETYGDTGLRAPERVAGGQLWIAQRWSVTPDGAPLLGEGVEPGEWVRMRRGVDAVLERALELARGEREDKAA